MKNLKIIKKLFVLIMIICMLSLIIVPINSSFAAATKYTQSLKSGISAFPKAYQTALEKLEDLHPNWTFEAYYTGIPWSTVILNETATHGRNRVINSSDSSWKCSCGNVASGYACASEGIIEYYLDPRNFLNEVNVFQFLEISYNSKIHTLSGIKSAVKGTFLDDTITYKKDGKSYTKTYSDIILDAAKQSNMSPYSIVTKIIQEVGSKGSSSVSGTYSGYEGYYNFYNLGAYDTGNAIVNGLKYAKDKGWNNQYDAIVEGAEEIANSYTNAGQNTAYFYKWDVVGTKILQSGKTQTVSSSDMFWHQYMTNVQDPTSQSKSLYNTYASNGILDKNLNFIIPVYEDMPSSAVGMPSGFPEGTENLYYVNCTDGLRVRSKASTSGSVLATLYKDTKVQMITKNYATANGYTWDKIKLANGVTGYVADKYLTACEDTSSSKEEIIGTAKTTENLKLRKTAGTSGVLLTTIPKGKEVDILQKNVSTANGYTWYKVTYGSYTGYVASEYLTNITTDSDSDSNSSSVTINKTYAEVSGSTITVTPSATLKNIASETATGTLKTGGSIKVGGKTYTVVMLGDTNGDGIIDARDSLRVLKYQLGKYNLNDEASLAGDVNGDGVVDARDSLRILKNQLGKYEISIN